MLKQKRLYESQREQLYNQQFNIEQTAFTMESAKDSVQTIQAMQVRGGRGSTAGRGGAGRSRWLTQPSSHRARARRSGTRLAGCEAGLAAKQLPYGAAAVCGALLARQGARKAGRMCWSNWWNRNRAAAADGAWAARAPKRFPLRASGARAHAARRRRARR